MRNPILKGFHPDPSAVRVGDTYYLATSTFEWHPGVMIYQSQDLVTWSLAARPLDRTALLDIKGVPDSCGVWAPCLSHDGKRFHLVYSQVRSFDGVWKDTPNYLTTAEDITGPWTDPIYLGSHGFDASLFHEEDGKKWYLSMEVDHRKGKFFGGIMLQEYHPNEKKLTGPLHRIFAGSALGKTEGPHLYKKDGLYYLITAEGGTEYGHAVTLARSKSITGPYELSPQHPFISTANYPLHPLQKTGHASMVPVKGDQWAIFFLTGRPLSPQGRCPLGRETAMELLNWPMGEWPRLASGDALPRIELDEFPVMASPIQEKIDFSQEKLPDTYHSLRVEISDKWCRHDPDSGVLILQGRESLTSTFEQSLIARRVQAIDFEYEIRFRFRPENFQQMAGLVCYYNTSHYFYLHLMGDEDGQSRHLQLMRCDNYQIEDMLPQAVPLPHSTGTIGLKVIWQQAVATFYYSSAPNHWVKLPGVYDASILSDDYVRDGSNRYRPAFTGTFVGIACQDLSGAGKEVKVLDLGYREKYPSP